MKKFDIKQLVIIFTEGEKHKIITQTISYEVRQTKSKGENNLIF